MAIENETPANITVEKLNRIYSERDSWQEAYTASQAECKALIHRIEEMQLSHIHRSDIEQIQRDHERQLAEARPETFWGAIKRIWKRRKQQQQ